MMFETPSIFHGQTDSKHLSGCPSPSKQQYGLVANHSRRQLAAASGWCAAWCIKFKSKFVSEAMVHQTHQTRFVLSYYWRIFQISNIDQILCVFICHGFPVCLPDHSGLALWPCPSIFQASHRGNEAQPIPELPFLAPTHRTLGKFYQSAMVNSENCWKSMKIYENCTLIDDPAM